jgi:hypothetical protein
MQLTSPHKLQEWTEPLPPVKAPMPYLVLFLIACVTVVAYVSVVADFFHGDDYIHLTWLPKAVHDPNLIARNFYSSWLDGFYAQFYRPLISVFNVFDYMVWRGNGVGFHVTNLVAHLVTTFFLFMIVRSLLECAESVGQKLSDPDRSVLASNLLPLGAAALFALYPIHPEAVSWITGRVDSICAMFTLGSLWLFQRWQKGRSYLALFASLLFFVLGLLSKEMAVTLPAVLVVYLLLFPRKLVSDAAPRDDRKIITLLQETAVSTTPYWLVWLGYFLVRQRALGTFVGGYDNALFFIPDGSAFFSRWGTALGNLLVPVNHNVTDPQSLQVIAWQVLLTGALSLSTFFAMRSAIIARIFSFSFIWMGLSLLPVIKCLYVHDDLEGARMVYLASAPLCLLVVLGLARLYWTGQIAKFISLIAGAGLLLLADVFLIANNRPWYQAGMETQAIERALKRVSRDISNNDHICYFVGIPNAIDGAYVGCNAFDGMTKVPRMDYDLRNYFGFSPIDRIFPYGFAKRKMPEMLGYTRVFGWDSNKKEFVRVTIPTIDTSIAQAWREGKSGSREGSMTSIPLKRKATLFDEVELEGEGLDCWNAEVLQFTLSVNRIGKSDQFRVAKLRYQNDLQTNYSDETEETSTLAPTTGIQKIIFPMKGNAYWWLGGHCKHLRVELPPDWNGRVVAVETLDPQKLIPKIDFVEQSRAHNLGPIVITAKYRICPVSFDVSKIEGANSAVLEFTRSNMFFDDHNSRNPSPVVGRRVPLPSVSGKFNIDAGEFSVPGIYEFRLRALDKVGNSVGLSSDHLTVFLQQPTR